MTQDELDQRIKDQTGEVLKGVIDNYVKDQLKEQLADATAKIKAELKPIEPILEVAQEAPKFKGLRDFLVSVRNFRMNRTLDNRLQYVPATGLTKTTGHMEIGDDAQGGFLVPEVYRMELQEIALENSVVRPRATVLPMTSDSLKIPYVNDTSHASTVFGGVVAYWTAEAKEKTASKPTFGQLELTPHKLAGLTYTSNELLSDSGIALEPLITRQFGSAWGYFEDDAFLAGSGAGQPLGVLNCGCMKSVFRNTTSRVHYEDIAEMYASMLPPSIPYAVWVISPTVIAELIELGSGNAADASGKILIWQNDAKVGPTWTLLGRPVIISEKLQALGTAGDIIFADFRYYLIGDRQPITIDASTHVAFTTDETAWRFVIRVAGQCWPQTTITSRRGSHTFSPFVQLSAATS
jgi:HK97 family phage major capsid protein